VSLDELGVSVARVWKFPESVVYCMRGLPHGPVEKPGSSLDHLRHFSVFANELCGLASTCRSENRADRLSRLVDRFEGSFSVSETEVLTLLQSAVHRVQKYAEIMNIDPAKSSFIQGLLKFIETGDGSNAAGTCRSQFPQASEIREAEDLPIKSGKGVEVKEDDTRTEPQGRLTVGAPSAGIREGVLRLTHKLGLKRQ
jgi:hypothetical protein